MEIKKGVLLSVLESDLEGGVFYNDKVIEVGEQCFVGFKALKKLILPNCEKVNYSIRDCAALTTLSLPVCTVVNNSIRDCAALTTLSLPVCKEVVNYSIRDCAALTTLSLPVCKEVVNYSIINCAALTTLSLPVCTVVNYSIRDCAALTTVKIGKIKLEGRSFDGYFFEITSEKSTKGIKIYTGFNFEYVKDGKITKKEGFVASKDKFNAHGETVKKAIGDLQFKIVAEKLKNEPIKENTIITIQYYRLITGACEQGVKSWINQVFNEKEKPTIIDKGIKAKDLLPILRSNRAYGIERFEKLITF